MRGFIRLLAGNSLTSENVHFIAGCPSSGGSLSYAAQKLAATRRRRHYFKLGVAVRANSGLVKFVLRSEKLLIS